VKQSYIATHSRHIFILNSTEIYLVRNSYYFIILFFQQRVLSRAIVSSASNLCIRYGVIGDCRELRYAVVEDFIGMTFMPNFIKIGQLKKNLNGHTHTHTAWSSHEPMFLHKKENCAKNWPEIVCYTT
jgi:hypothetical protein